MNPPKPTKLKIIQGNPGKRPLNKNEPDPPVVSLRCPRDLPPVAKKEWRRVAKQLKALGLTTEIDRAILEGYCWHYARWKEHVEWIKKNGDTIYFRDADGNIKYAQKAPAVSMAYEEFKLMKRCADEFGMGPASRSRISVPWAAGDTWDEFRRKK